LVEKLQVLCKLAGDDGEKSLIGGEETLAAGEIVPNKEAYEGVFG
jgi:hypothetical protein